jgi:hypothetical protein
LEDKIRQGMIPGHPAWEESFLGNNYPHTLKLNHLVKLIKEGDEAILRSSIR